MPSPPYKLSAPAAPSRELFPVFPVRLFDKEFPAALRLASVSVELLAFPPVTDGVESVPQRVRFSTFAELARVKSIFETTKSMPSFDFSITASKLLSTMKLSSPLPPINLSAPSPPSMESFPVPPTRLSSSPRPMMVSFPPAPSIRSTNSVPVILSSVSPGLGLLGSELEGPSIFSIFL